MRHITVSAWYGIATPLFCAGSAKADVRIRPASVKGLLRWWWRATRWATLVGTTSPGAGAATTSDHLGCLQREEARLFGASGDGSGRGQASLRVVPLADGRVCAAGTERRAGRDELGPGARYLGYGLVKPFGQGAGELLRACQVFDASKPAFRLDLLCRNLTEDEISSLELALSALGLLGGFGARSRRGWGSTALLGLGTAAGFRPPVAPASGERVEPPDREGLGRQIRRLLEGVPPGGEPYPPITALGPRSRVVAVFSSKPPLEALDEVGKELVRYRSWGHGELILDRERAEQNFQDDHDLMKRAGRRETHPRRVAFGLPQNYGTDGSVRPANSGRRASPLLLHVHPLRPSGSAIVCTMLPATFVPEPARLRVGNDEVDLEPLDQLYKPVEAFLDRTIERLHGIELTPSGWQK